MTSTTRNNDLKKTDRKYQNILAVALLLLLWQGAASLVGQRVIFASPLEVLRRLPELAAEPDFLSSVGFSFLRIAEGFLAGFVTALLLAVLSGRFPLLETLLSPLMVTVKSVPVASFIIIALVWLSSAQLSAFISFLMVLPVIYTGCLSGIRNIDRKMLEMAGIYRLSFAKRFRYIWLPSMRPYILSSCHTALGLSWKAGIAAEVIGIPDGSLGEKLYEAKVYLATADLFAWTVVIVLVSVLFEKAVTGLLRLFYKKLFASGGRA